MHLGGTVIGPSSNRAALRIPQRSRTRLVGAKPAIVVTVRRKIEHGREVVDNSAEQASLVKLVPQSVTSRALDISRAALRSEKGRRN